MRGQALQIERERPSLQNLLGGLRHGEQIAAPEQRGDACEKMRQAHILGKVVIGAKPEAHDDVEVGVARGKKDDRHTLRHCAQFATEREAAVDVVTKPDIDERKIREPRTERRQGVVAIGIGRDFIALLAQHIGVVLADGGLVFDDGDAAAHGDAIRFG